MMKKWQKVTIWVASILIVLVVGGLFAANYAVDKVLNSMVGMSIDNLLVEDDSVVVGNEPYGEASPISDGAEATSPEDDIAQTDGNVYSDQQHGTEQPASTNDGGRDTKPAAPDDTNKQVSAEKPQTTTQPVSTTKPEGDKSDSDYSAEISTDKAKEVQDNITVSEKAKVVTTLMGSLSASDISTLQKLASGGLSVEEKKQAKEIMLEKLSEDQYNELISIAAKHGLSQGKKYSETKAE